jgi:hypothetical protein
MARLLALLALPPPVRRAWRCEMDVVCRWGIRAGCGSTMCREKQRLATKAAAAAAALAGIRTSVVGEVFLPCSRLLRAIPIP